MSFLAPDPDVPLPAGVEPPSPPFTVVPPPFAGVAAGVMPPAGVVTPGPPAGVVTPPPDGVEPPPGIVVDPPLLAGVEPPLPPLLVVDPPLPLGVEGPIALVVTIATVEGTGVVGMVDTSHKLVVGDRVPFAQVWHFVESMLQFAQPGGQGAQVKSGADPNVALQPPLTHFPGPSISHPDGPQLGSHF